MNDEELDGLLKRALVEPPARDEAEQRRRVMAKIRAAADQELDARLKPRRIFTGSLWQRWALAGVSAAACLGIVLWLASSIRIVPPSQISRVQSEANYGPMPPPNDPSLSIVLSTNAEEASPIHNAHLFQSDPLLRPHSRWEQSGSMDDEI